MNKRTKNHLEDWDTDANGKIDHNITPLLSFRFRD